MAERTVLVCDGCGSEQPGIQTLRFTVDRKMDAAGSMEDHWQRIDLCPSCLARNVLGSVEGMEQPNRRAWAEAVLHRGKTARRERGEQG